MLEKRILPQMKWLKKIINNYPSEILSDEEKDLLELAISDFIELIIELRLPSLILFSPNKLASLQGRKGPNKMKHNIEDTGEHFGKTARGVREIWKGSEQAGKGHMRSMRE